MRRFALILLIPLALSAQGRGTGVMPGRGGVGATQTPPPPPTPAQDLATVEGQVVNALTGEPLRKANINMNRSDNTPTSGQRSFSAVSDASGRFQILRVEPGTYRVSCNRTGFLGMEYNARRPDGPGTRLDVGRGQKVTGVTFKLSPHGVIAGKIVDEDGDPVQNVQIQLMRIVYTAARKQLQQQEGAETNDLGEFRIAGVPPGKYYLCATYRNRRIVMNGQVQDDSQQQDYAPTFYPGVTDVASAMPIEMKASAQVAGVNIRLNKIHTVHVRGRVVNNIAPPAPAPVPPVPPNSTPVNVNGQQTTVVTPDGNMVITIPNVGNIMNRMNVSVRLMPRSQLIPGGGGNNMSTAVRPDGTFDFASVPPGSYTLIAQTNQGNKSHSVHQMIDVGSSNLDNLNLAINPGLTVMGSIKLDGTPQDTPPTFSVRLTLREPGTGSNPPQAVKADSGGAFHIEDIDPNRYSVTVTPLPQGYYIKSIMSGRTNVMASGLDLTNGAANLEIVVSPNAPQVTGSVQNTSTSQPAIAATVVLIPQEPERKEQSYYYTTTTTDQYGHFTFQRVVPGEYKAYAFEDVESGAWYDPDFIKAVASKGESISVREGSPATVSLLLIQ